MEKMNSFDFDQTQVGYITECVEPISGIITLRDALDYFDGNPDLPAVPGELSTGYGLLSRDYFEHNKISMLNVNKPVSSLEVLQDNPDSFNSRENVRKIFRQIAREEGEEGRYYIVYHNNNLFGVTRLRDIIRHVSDIQEWEAAHAKSIQEKILKNNLLRDPTFRIHADIRWAHDLGGDYYYSARITETLSMVSCFDITGDHITASLVSVMIDSYFKTRNLMDDLEKDDVEKLILSLNSFLLEQTPEDCSVRAVFLFLRRDEGAVHLYNFGYSPPFLVLSEENKIRAKMIAPQYKPLGTEDIVIFREKPLILDLENLKNIFIYSDGIENCVNAFGERFGTERIKNCVVRNYKLLGDGFSQALNAEIDDFRHDAPLTDDITSVIINFS